MSESTMMMNGNFLEWRNNEGKLHRLDGPAAIYSNGKQEWYQNGLLYRDSGPAVVYPDGTMAWLQDDELHRKNGPAVIYSNGDIEWWIDGIRLLLGES